MASGNVAQILRWYASHQRDLPWRRPDATAWAVLVSEVMLQQTPVARVLPVYEAWLARWPTPASLAAASAGDAVRAWGRLGYPRRALRLHETSRILTQRHGGEVPASVDALLALPVGDYPDNGGGIVRDGQQILVARGDLALGEDPAADPGQQPGPVLAADQHDRELRDLAGMDQGERLEQLVQGAEPARQHHERLRVLDEDGLADEEVPELQADLDVLIQPHLHGQLDAQAHRDTTHVRRALVGRFHDPGASPGDHGVAGLGERRRDALGQLIIGGVRLGPGRPEYRHGRAELGEQAESLDEFRLDPQHAPWVRMHPVAGATPVEQSLTGGGVRDELAAQHGRPLAAHPTA